MQQQQQTQQLREDMYRQALQQTSQRADSADQHVREANQAIMVAQRNQDSAAVEAAQRLVASAQAEMAAVKQEMARQAADLAAKTAEADRKSQTADQLILNAQRANDAGALKAATEAKAEADKGRAQREQALKDIGEKAKSIGATAAAATTAAATRAHEAATSAATKAKSIGATAATTIQDRFKAFMSPQEPVVANAITTEAADTSPQNNPFESPTPVNPPTPPVDDEDIEEEAPVASEDIEEAPLFARPQPVDDRTALLGPDRPVNPELRNRYLTNETPEPVDDRPVPPVNTDEGPLFARPQPVDDRTALLGPDRPVNPELRNRYLTNETPEPLDDRTALLGPDRPVNENLRDRYMNIPPVEPLVAPSSPEPEPEPLLAPSGPEPEAPGWKILNTEQIYSTIRLGARAGRPAGSLYVPAIEDFFTQRKMMDASISEEEMDNKVLEAEKDLGAYIVGVKASKTDKTVKLAKLAVEMFKQERGIFKSKEPERTAKRDAERSALERTAAKQAAAVAKVEAAKAKAQKESAKLDAELDQLQASLGPVSSPEPAAPPPRESVFEPGGSGGTRRSHNKGRRSTYRRTR